MFFKGNEEKGGSPGNSTSSCCMLLQLGESLKSFFAFFTKNSRPGCCQLHNYFLSEHVANPFHFQAVNNRKESLCTGQKQHLLLLRFFLYILTLLFQIFGIVQSLSLKESASWREYLCSLSLCLQLRLKLQVFLHLLEEHNRKGFRFYVIHSDSYYQSYFVFHFLVLRIRYLSKKVYIFC